MNDALMFLMLACPAFVSIMTAIYLILKKLKDIDGKATAAFWATYDQLKTTHDLVDVSVAKLDGALAEIQLGDLSARGEAMEKRRRGGRPSKLKLPLKFETYRKEDVDGNNNDCEV